MEQIRQKMTMLTQHLEEHGDKYLSKRSRKKFLSSAGPGFLVLTFIEDGLRIFLRWGEQHHYMTKRMGMGGFFAGFILLLSAAVQLGGAALILRPDTFRPSRVKSASYMLLGFVALQPFMYGQATDADFMCRSITLAGGFLLLIWSENERVSKAEGMGGLLQGGGGLFAGEDDVAGSAALVSPQNANSPSLPCIRYQPTLRCIR